MTQTEYTTRVISAEAGKYLTQASNDIDLLNRVVTNAKVYLAVNDSPDNWREISAEEANNIIKAQEEAAQKQAEEDEATAE
jgi:hypothetical protein